MTWDLSQVKSIYVTKITETTFHLFQKELPMDWFGHGAMGREELQESAGQPALAILSPASLVEKDKAQLRGARVSVPWR